MSITAVDESLATRKPPSYAAPEGVLDEVFEADGSPRPHCRHFVESLRGLGQEEMRRRWDHARRLIRDNGVTYNVYGDPRGIDRPWELDAVPLLVSSEDWARLSRGLAQRAELLNRVIADLYGPQRLLRTVLLPPEFVFEHPGFLRAMSGASLPSGVSLHLYAADLARTANGEYRVLGDRTQSPSGSGYALENRLVIARTLPELFRDCRVQRLAAYFRALRRMLANLAPRGRENPRIVLLTPGPYNETYFEHAYLARYLGFALVEGGDLTVRDQVVYMKTLGGLERVDVILRRLDGLFCDPLSLRPDSSLGIAGLVHAVRAGTVAVANALGSGIAESPALLGFLPRLARAVLGEELSLPSVPTHWCGESESRELVLSRIEDYVIKPAYPGATWFEPVFVGRLSEAEKGDLVARIRAKPTRFVAQERLSLSTSPVWGGMHSEPRHVALRAYLTRSGDGYEAMPGGLARVAAQDSLVVSMQRGGGSKDVWVLAGDQEVSPITLLRTGPALEIMRSGGDLPSRVADNLFWLGRYLERAEGTVRLARSVLVRMADEATPGAATEVATLLRGLLDNGELTESALAASGVGRSLEARVVALLFAKEPAHPFRTNVSSAYRAASLLRDRISSDLWRVVSRIHHLVTDACASPPAQLAPALDLLGQLLLHFAALSGLSSENMTHGPGYRFADMGRRLERLHHTVRLLRVLLVPVRDEDTATLEAVLEVSDSIITYRSRYAGTFELPPVLDLLLTDESNPRSVAYQLTRLRDHIDRLPSARQTSLLAPEAKVALKVLSRVRLVDVFQVAERDPSGARASLAALLTELEHDGPSLAEALSRAYLTHAAPSQSLGGLTEPT